MMSQMNMNLLTTIKKSGKIESYLNRLKKKEVDDRCNYIMERQKNMPIKLSKKL